LRDEKCNPPASELRLALNLIDIGDGWKAIHDDKRSWRESGAIFEKHHN
jgi:hypothetical protein